MHIKHWLGSTHWQNDNPTIAENINQLMCFIIPGFVIIFKLPLMFEQNWQQSAVGDCTDNVVEAILNVLQPSLVWISNKYYIDPKTLSKRSTLTITFRILLQDHSYPLSPPVFFHCGSLTMYSLPPLSSFYPDYLTILRCYVARLD